MKNNLSYEITEITFSPDKFLSIEVKNIGVLASYDLFTQGGGFGQVWLKDIPLDEVIHLRNRLSEIIDAEVAKLNATVNNVKHEEYHTEVLKNTTYSEAHEQAIKTEK